MVSVLKSLLYIVIMYKKRTKKNKIQFYGKILDFCVNELMEGSQRKEKIKKIEWITKLYARRDRRRNSYVKPIMVRARTNVVRCV